MNYNTDADVRREFYRIQQKLAQVICRDVLSSEGLFYYGPVPSDEGLTRQCLQIVDLGFRGKEGK